MPYANSADWFFRIIAGVSQLEYLNLNQSGRSSSTSRYGSGRRRYFSRRPYVLSNIDGRAILPFVSAYLLVMGLFILMKAAKLAPTNEDAKVGYAAPLGLIGGFLDAIGGGGWGPMVTSTLIGSGHAPRKVIGSVNAAEFFITVAVATTFFIELATAHVAHIAALIIGGLLAAPFAGYIVRHLQPRPLMTAVGVLVSALALFQLAKSFG